MGPRLRYALPRRGRRISLIIRCERCSTLYELDESLLAPEGSDVQCARCQHVFRAHPLGAAGQTLQGVPAAEAAPPVSASVPPDAPPAPPPAAEPHALASAAHQAPRYTPGAAVYRAPISQPSVPRPPLLRKDTVGTFESRLRWSHRWRWLGPTVFAAVVGVGVVAFLLRDGLGDLRARGAHHTALEIACRDDLSSLKDARSRLDDALRVAPRLHAAEADRALVELLMAGAMADQSLDPSNGGRARKDDTLVAHASASLEQLERAGLAPAEVARARAVAAALGSDRAQLKRLATAARSHLSDDPFVQIAEESAEVRAGDRAARERAVGALSLLVSRRPELIRARYVLARGQALSGRRTEALATLQALLKANPRHEAALALKEGLMRSAPAAGSPAPGPTALPAVPPPPGARAEKLATQPRKADSTSGEGAAAAAGGGSAKATSAPATPRAVSNPAEEPGAGAGAPDGTAAGTDRAPGEGEPPPVVPRLRPAVVPEPEPVQGGG